MQMYKSTCLTPFYVAIYQLVNVKWEGDGGGRWTSRRGGRGGGAGDVMIGERLFHSRFNDSINRLSLHIKGHSTHCYNKTKMAPTLIRQLSFIKNIYA